MRSRDKIDRKEAERMARAASAIARRRKESKEDAPVPVIQAAAIEEKPVIEPVEEEPPVVEEVDEVLEFIDMVREAWVNRKGLSSSTEGDNVS